MARKTNKANGKYKKTELPRYNTFSFPIKIVPPKTAPKKIGNNSNNSHADSPIEANSKPIKKKNKAINAQ